MQHRLDHPNTHVRSNRTEETQHTIANVRYQVNFGMLFSDVQFYSRADSEGKHGDRSTIENRKRLYILEIRVWTNLEKYWVQWLLEERLYGPV